MKARPRDAILVAFAVALLFPLVSAKDKTIGLVTVLAGSGTEGLNDGPSWNASFSIPTGIAVGSDGVVYVTDSGNNKIRIITANDASVRTLVDSIEGPSEVALTPSGGHLLITASNGKIFRVSTTDGSVSKMGLDPLPNASFAFDPEKKLIYIASFSGSLHQIYVFDGKDISVLVGDVKGFKNGDGSDARFNAPSDIVYDAEQNVFYVADTGNNRIRVISRADEDTVQVTTLAGSSKAEYADGYGTAASFDSPEGLAFDPSSRRLFVADTGNGLIRSINVDSGSVSTLAGRLASSTYPSGFSEGYGPSATFGRIRRLAWDFASGLLYATDSRSHKIAKIVLEDVDESFVVGYSPSKVVSDTTVVLDATLIAANAPPRVPPLNLLDTEGYRISWSLKSKPPKAPTPKLAGEQTKELRVTGLVPGPYSFLYVYNPGKVRKSVSVLVLATPVPSPPDSAIASATETPTPTPTATPTPTSPTPTPGRFNITLGSAIHRVLPFSSLTLTADDNGSGFPPKNYSWTQRDRCIPLNADFLVSSKSLVVNDIFPGNYTVAVHAEDSTGVISRSSVDMIIQSDPYARPLSKIVVLLVGAVLILAILGSFIGAKRLKYGDAGSFQVFLAMVDHLQFFALLLMLCVAAPSSISEYAEGFQFTLLQIPAPWTWTSFPPVISWPHSSPCNPIPIGPKVDTFGSLFWSLAAILLVVILHSIAKAIYVAVKKRKSRAFFFSKKNMPAPWSFPSFTLTVFTIIFNGLALTVGYNFGIIRNRFKLYYAEGSHGSSRRLLSTELYIEKAKTYLNTVEPYIAPIASIPIFVVPLVLVFVIALKLKAKYAVFDPSSKTWVPKSEHFNDIENGYSDAKMAGKPLLESSRRTSENGLEAPPKKKAAAFDKFVGFFGSYSVLIGPFHDRRLAYLCSAFEFIGKILRTMVLIGAILPIDGTVGRKAQLYGIVILLGFRVLYLLISWPYSSIPVGIAVFLTALVELVAVAVVLLPLGLAYINPPTWTPYAAHGVVLASFACVAILALAQIWLLFYPCFRKKSREEDAEEVEATKHIDVDSHDYRPRDEFYETGFDQPLEKPMSDTVERSATPRQGSPPPPVEIKTALPDKKADFAAEAPATLPVPSQKTPKRVEGFLRISAGGLKMYKRHFTLDVEAKQLRRLTSAKGTVVVIDWNKEDIVEMIQKSAGFLKFPKKPTFKVGTVNKANKRRRSVSLQAATEDARNAWMGYLQQMQDNGTVTLA